jgi:hypothetical protein
MHKDNYIVAIKRDRKILREVGQAVYLPFGSEYSILIKNLLDTKCKVTVKIDGSIVSGSGIILSGYESLELERFITDNSLSAGNKFKFIEKTEEISNFRGDKIEDGVVQVEIQQEKPQFQFTTTYTKTRSDLDPIWMSRDVVRASDGILRANINTVGIAGTRDMTGYDEVPRSLYSNQASSFSTTDAGITVQGSKSSQEFREVSDIMVEDRKTVITLSLKGEVGNNKVKSAIEVKKNLNCKTCGRSNKSNFKFCTNCGTSLITYL